jgi:hypothetical protein
VRQPGLPPDLPRPKSSAFEVVDQARAEWLSGKKPDQLATKGWVTQQWIHFLDGMPDTIDAKQMAALDDAFHFTKSGNSEILCSWLRLGIQHGYAASDQRLREFLMNVGRRKFLKPLYAEMAKSEAGKEKARAIYAEARPRYHAVATETIDKILSWKEAGAR